jgi:cytochrome c oxidase cbb3-type subunit 3/ubiquinol-cytochrome c reductase cytochrome c subunit
MPRSPLPLVVLALLPACKTSQHPDADDYDTPEQHGAALYDTYCGFCHGAQGEGYVSDNANALANQDFLRIASDEFLASSIMHGRPGTPMSAWGTSMAGPLSDEDVEHLVAYIRSWQTVEPLDVDGYELPADASVMRGASYYAAAGCDDCHGELGKGGPYITLENPWFLTEVSDGYLYTSIAEGRRDTPMPSFAATLSEAQIADIVALLRSWEREPNTDPLPPFEPDVSDACLNPGGPDPAFELVDDRFIGVDAVHTALAAGSKMIIMDARGHADFVEGHIEGAVSVPFYQLESVIDELPKDVWIVAYCGCPHAISGQAFDALRAAGFTKTAVLDEGYYVWVERGYPVATGE